MPFQPRPAAATDTQFVAVVKNGLPGSDWVPTVVNPNQNGNTMQKLLFWGHILLHVIALLLSGTNGFALAALQAKSDPCTDDSCFSYAPSNSVIAFGIVGSTCHVVSIVLILLGAGLFNREQYKKMVWYNSLLMTFTNFAVICSIFVFARAARAPSSMAFWLAMPGAIIHVFSVSMLYSTASAMGVKALSRSFLLTLAMSLDLFAAILFQTGEWTAFGNPIEPTQKTMAWVCAGTQIGGMTALLLGRILSRNSLSVNTFSKFPFYRSLILTLYAISAITASYKFGLVNATNNLEIVSFGIPSTILTYITFAIMFTPSDAIAYPPMPVKADADGETEDEGEAEEAEEADVEARYGRGLKLGRMP